MLFVVIECCWVTHLFRVWVACSVQAIHVGFHDFPVNLCICRLSNSWLLNSWIHFLHVNLARSYNPVHIFEIITLDIELTLELPMICLAYHFLVIHRHCPLISCDHLRIKFCWRWLLFRHWKIHIHRSAFWRHTPLLIHIQVLFNLCVFAAFVHHLGIHIILSILKVWQSLYLHHSLFVTALSKFVAWIQDTPRWFLHFAFLQEVHC